MIVFILAALIAFIGTVIILNAVESDKQPESRAVPVPVEVDLKPLFQRRHYD